MINNKKHIGVLFSGGLDSTYLIYWYLEHYPNCIVHAAYSEILNNKYKVEMEIAAIKKLVLVFKENYGSRFVYEGIIQKTEIFSVGDNKLFHQMPVWISSILNFNSNIDTIAIGYVMNDDAISYINDIKKLWKAYSFLLNSSAKLEFPLIKINKLDIIDDLPEIYKMHVVSCENPIIDKINANEYRYYPCGKCLPCKRSPLLEYHLSNLPPLLTKIKNSRHIQLEMKFDGFDKIHDDDLPKENYQSKEKLNYNN